MTKWNPKYKLLLSIFLVLATQQLSGQFYNGHQMTFGKNRVQFNDFYWSFQRYERFDTYFNEYGKNIAEYTAEFAEKELDRVESLFDYNLDQRIIFLIYNKLSDFRQSNIGLVTGSTENNIGGVTQIDRNKVFVYFEGDYKKLEKQISRAIVEVLITEMIYGQNFRQKVTSSTLVNLPDWYLDGLVAYISDDWDFNVENRVKDGILSKKYKKFSRLVGDDARYAGQSFWQYIADQYGESAIPSILYLTKVNKNANMGFLYVLGSPLKILAKDWYAYYQDLYSEHKDLDQIPNDGQIKKRPRKNHVYQQVKMNPLGNYVAYVTNHMGQYKVWVQNIHTGKRKKIIKKEHKLEQITDFSYPVLAWHPTGRILTFITEEEGGLRIYYYTFGEKELQVRNFLYFEKVLDYSFSHDGTLLVLSAIKNGKTDIYVHNLAAGTNHQITHDIAADLQPRFINDSKQIIFSSDRRSDSLSVEAKDKKLAMTKDLFIFDNRTEDDKLIRLSDEAFTNKTNPLEVGRNQFISLSDRNGVINQYYSRFDSAVSFVDTTVHYRYIAHTNPLTNYPRNILAHDYNQKAGKGAEIIFKKGRYYTYARNLRDNEVYPTSLPKTDFRIEHSKELAIKDSLQKIVITDILIDSLKNNMLVHKEDTIVFDAPEIDINNYVFEIERLNSINSKLKSRNFPLRIIKRKEKNDNPVNIYQEAFYQNYFVSQIDFSFLSQSYQAFTGGAVYFTPGVNGLIKIGTNDLFEDYKITGGFRIPLNLESSEVLLSFEDLKSQLDRQYIFHRQALQQFGGENNTEYIKTITNEFSAIYKYPFSQVHAVQTTLGLRSDRNVYLFDTDITKLTASLEKPDQYKFWATIKPEFIFDNTRSLGTNLLGGTRLKLFGEYYQQLNDKFDYLFVLGVDIRRYVVIHRNLIWASRFAASSSFGSAKLIYYLGGVDNWTRFIPNNEYPTFIPLSEIRIDEDANYAYQAVATNMRGFSQNIRNGSSFALINTEIRWPVISYFVNRPLSNTFLQNFQTIGFFDIGTAWSGLHPWSGKNAYDNDIIYQGPITIEIDADREPIVAGYGFGFRSTLFGYFVRFDWAWGIENMQVLPRMFYFSLSLDF